MTVFWRALSALALALCVFGPDALAQGDPGASGAVASTAGPARPPGPGGAPPAGSAVRLYYDPLQGASSTDLVRRALQSNGELAAARLDIERARARLRQAGLRPNPTLDFEQTTGRLTGSAGESETSVGVSVPLELGGQRRRRIEVARVELEAAEAEVADRERRLAAEVLGLYAEALSSLRELDITEGLTDLDLKTVVVVQARVNEGESAPIELNLLRAEVERLRTRRALTEGRLQATLLRLKLLAGVPHAEPLRLREELARPALRQPPGSVEAAVEVALRTRPDVRLARLTEEVAEAGLRLVRAQSSPEVTAFTRYTVSRGAFDDTPVGTLRDKDRLLTFGVSVGIPVFNKNQGAKAEAAAVISQARARREFLEAVVRSEVASAYARYEAASKALLTYEQGVIQRSQDNVRVMRAAYELGQFSVTELLAEQRRLVDSQRDFTEALAEQYRALADLQSAVGAPVNQQ
ncbi:MAG TPA: TolC family protein [Pyrinomonadaceae bacterium]|nr:TolC family protein [Pyrinomonadaceae bacterium]